MAPPLSLVHCTLLPGFGAISYYGSLFVTLQKNAEFRSAPRYSLITNSVRYSPQGSQQCRVRTASHLTHRGTTNYEQVRHCPTTFPINPCFRKRWRQEYQRPHNCNCRQWLETLVALRVISAHGQKVEILKRGLSSLKVRANVQRVLPSGRALTRRQYAGITRTMCNFIYSFLSSCNNSYQQRGDAQHFTETSKAVTILVDQQHFPKCWVCSMM